MRHSDSAVHHEDTHDATGQPGIEAALRYVLAIGITLVVLLPGARGFSETLGWMPLWLLAMPAVAWWALRGFPLPKRGAEETPASRARRTWPQARRRSRPLMRKPLARAA